MLTERNMMSKEQQALDVLSDIVVFSKYARFIPHLGRRETWEEIVTRNFEMHLKKFGKHGEDLIKELSWAYSYVLDKKVLPSMRSMQFAGKAIELNESRIFNCSFLPIDDPAAFHEIMFLLLGGCGVGYSVQNHHIEKLPELLGPSKKTKRFVIGDSAIGWADSIKSLMFSYFYNKPQPLFIFDDIRKKGTPLKTSGGKAPGPEPLKDALHNVQKILDRVLEERGSKTKLKSIEIHDIICHISDAVLAGGIRRSSLISLFSFDDTDMLTCKFGNWYESNPQRARANNSVVMLRHKAKRKHFDYIWERVKASGSGEPGILFLNDKDSGHNPCVEALLKPFSFCNLTTVNVSNLESQEDFNNRVKAAAIIGTLQASYTDFHYLRQCWKDQTEEDALLGISMTGIATGKVFEYNMVEAASVAVNINKQISSVIGINQAARITLTKPEGTSSLVVGSSSGIHAWHAPYYIRRLRFGKEEPIYKYLKHAIPNLVEDDFFKPTTQGIVSIPIKAPEGAVFRDESPMQLLDRVKRVSEDWIKPGFIRGNDSHNVSCTVTVKDGEWDKVGEWMWENREVYNGLSVLPYDGHTYVQTPFEEISKEKYEELIQHIRHIDLTKVKEEDDMTEHKQEAACAGGKCEI